MGFLSDLLGGADRQAAERNRGLIAEYGAKGTGYLDAGLNKSSGYLNQAVGAYQPLSDLAGQYRGVANTYLNELTGNGPSAYTAAPGYQQGIDAGLTAINRRRAAGGMLDSGNADLDALTFAQTEQNKGYNSWLDRLAGVNNNAMATTGAVASGQAGAYGSLADLYNQDAQNRVNLQGSITSGGMQANNQEAAGRSAGARNLLSAGMGLASLATGGGFGFGGGSTAGTMNYGGQTWPMFR